MSTPNVDHPLPALAVTWPTTAEVDSTRIELPRPCQWTAVASAPAVGPDLPGVRQGVSPEPAVAGPGASAPPVTAAPPKCQRPASVLPGSVQELAWDHSLDAARLLRTMLLEDVCCGGDAPAAPRIAVVCAALGAATAGQVLKHLSQGEIDEIALSVAAMGSVPAAVAAGALDAFRRRLLAREWAICGGADLAREMVLRACGQTAAGEASEPLRDPGGLDLLRLRRMAPDQLAPFVSREHPQAMAAILSRLDPQQSSGVLACLSDRLQADVAYRMATIEDVTPEALGQLTRNLASSLRGVLAASQDIDGPKAVALMLNCTSTSTEKQVLDEMDAHDPDVAEAVRNSMFVFEDLEQLTDREIQTLLRGIDQKDLVIALKGAEPELRNKFLSNVSETVRTFLIEEMGFLGPMRLSEVQQVQLRIVQHVRQLEEMGQLTIVRDERYNRYV